MKSVLKVEGMSCSHCVDKVEKFIGELDGVSSIDVSLENKTVTVEHDDKVKVDSIKEAIEDAGYDVVG
ncbi:copper resistance protein CopZ [Helicobacter sp. 13S00401-1]|uniref:copper ion binding protein n=1 Tax=Helicobacter sp. 13S00401-1 TaxID=1905758 RepID=UPI000BA5E7E2|nr:copper ion binding protein [Helicobacter sp. 13S00401-1]PAF50751.1 copper resistance protein CopZ [Helicobacter sp. 13S00401-1]